MLMSSACETKKAWLFHLDTKDHGTNPPNRRSHVPDHCDDHLTASAGSMVASGYALSTSAAGSGPSSNARTTVRGSTPSAFRQNCPDPSHCDSRSTASASPTA